MVGCSVRMTVCWWWVVSVKISCVLVRLLCEDSLVCVVGNFVVRPLCQCFLFCSDVIVFVVEYSFRMPMRLWCVMLGFPLCLL